MKNFLPNRTVSKLTLICGLGLFTLVDSVSAEWRECITVDDFRGFGRCTSFEEIKAHVGEPTEDRGSGIHVLVYPLCDGKEVILGTPDKKEILYMKVISKAKVVEVLINPVMKKVNCGKAKNRG